MTTLQVSSKGHSPKKIPGWMWIVVGLLVLLVLGNAIYMATDTGAEEESAQEASAGVEKTTEELAMDRALEKIDAVLRKQDELLAATDDAEKTRLHRELSELIQDALSEDMKEAIREDPDGITQALAELLRDAIIAKEIAAELAGNPEVAIDNALAAQELKILLESLRGSLNSASYPQEAQAIDAIIAEAQASAARSAERLLPFYK